MFPFDDVIMLLIAIFIKPYLLKSSKQKFNSHYQISPLKGAYGVQHNTPPNTVTMYDRVHRNTDHAFKTHDLVSEIGNLFDIMTINFSKFNFLSLLPRRKSNDKRCEDLYNWLKSRLWALGDSFNSNYREQSGYRHHKYQPYKCWSPSLFSTSHELIDRRTCRCPSTEQDQVINEHNADYNWTHHFHSFLSD